MAFCRDAVAKLISYRHLGIGASLQRFTVLPEYQRTSLLQMTRFAVRQHDPLKSATGQRHHLNLLLHDYEQVIRSHIT